MNNLPCPTCDTESMSRKKTGEFSCSNCQFYCEKDSFPCSSDENVDFMIGRFYMVKCFGVELYDSFADRDFILYAPVLGKIHDEHDERGVKADQNHFHVDYRFLTEFYMMVLHYHQVEIPPGGIFFCNDKHFEIVLPMKYHRDFSLSMSGFFLECVLDNQKHFNLTNLKRKCNKCPHKGFDLSQVKSFCHEGRMIKVCPLHFLSFDEKTGEQAHWLESQKKVNLKTV